LILLVVVPLQGCVFNATTSHFYSTPNMTDTQWERYKAECRYEANLAVASNPKPSATITRQNLLHECLLLKGGVFVGRVTMPADELSRVTKRCRDEAAASVNQIPASMARHNQQEALEIACMKREGMVFSPNF
jgi:hypothetical protein